MDYEIELKMMDKPELNEENFVISLSISFTTYNKGCDFPEMKSVSL